VNTASLVTLSPNNTRSTNTGAEKAQNNTTCYANDICNAVKANKLKPVGTLTKKYDTVSNPCKQSHAT